MQSGQYKKVDRQGENIIREGCASMKVPDKVFYNKVQVINRDLSILSIRAWYEEYFSRSKKFKDSSTKPKFRILEALSATGLRSVRYWNEIPNVEKIIANDLDEKAVTLIKENIELNEVSDGVVSSHADAIDLLYQHRKDRFDVIDLDPYGTVSPFVDAAVQAVSNNGLLCVTSTDGRVLAGHQYNVAMQRYHTVILNSDYSHEQGIRSLVKMFVECGAKYRRAIEPILCLKIDFYFRLFFRVSDRPKVALEACLKYASVYQCVQCPHFEIQPLLTPSTKIPSGAYAQHPPLCPSCDGKRRVGGPFWSSTIQNGQFISRIIDILEKERKIFKTHQRMLGLLDVCRNEISTPFFYKLNQLHSTTKTNNISMKKWHNVIRNAGFQVSRTHIHGNGLKTDAPISLLYDVCRHLLEKERKEKKDLNSSSKEKTKDTSKGNPLHGKLNQKIENRKKLHVKVFEKIMHKEITHKLDFSDNGILKLNHGAFAPNPEKFWGPKPRATRETDKRKPETQDPIEKEVKRKKLMDE